MKKPQLSDDQIRAIVARELRLSQGSERSELSKKRLRSLEYYQGTMKDTPSEEGRSSVVSLDVSDTIGWMLPGIVRVFTASDHMANAEPVEKNDIEAARQATDGMNYVFWKQNEGYKILYNATHDSLLLGNGIVKAYWDDYPEYAVSTHTGLSDEQLAMLIEGEEVEVQTHTLNEDATHDVKIRRLKTKGKVCISVIAPEDFFIDPDAKSIDDARFLGDREEVTRSSLIEDGYDPEKVNSIKMSDDDTVEEEARGDLDNDNEAADDSVELVDKYECQLKIDVDGDGMAETVRAIYAGNLSGGVLLDWEVWESEPLYYDIPCDPVPHRWDARSVADVTMDVQRIKTVLLRQALDNIYAANIPQKEAEKDSVINPQELTNPSFGGIIWRKAGSNPIVPHVTPFIANHAFDAINYQDQVIERRTGVSRQTMALDPEALQNQTATANQNARDAAYSRIELVARNQAELGWRKLFRGIMKLMVRHQDRPMMVRLRGDKWTDVDPRHWNADMDVTINVGLGTGSRDRDYQMLKGILADQVGLADRFASVGFEEKALEMLPFIHTTLTKIAESAGIKAPEQFYPEFTADLIEQGKQSIAQRKSQPPMELQIEQMKVKAQAEIETAKAAAARDKEMAQMEADIAVKNAELEKNRALEDQRMAFEAEKFNAEQALEREKMAQAKELELLKLGMKDKGPDAGGVVNLEDERNNAIASMIDRLTAALERPKRLVRDPLTGKASHVESFDPMVN